MRSRISSIFFSLSIPHIVYDTHIITDRELVEFYEKELSARPSRLHDVLNVITDQLFGFYGPAPQLVASLIDRIAGLPDAQPLLNTLRSILHEHKEFEQCGKLIPQQQMRFELRYLLHL